MTESASGYGKAAEKAIDSWAVEGEKVVGRISEGKVVDEITSKVDLDQAKEQVSKLRDQLEDMLATWRSSFRPEKVAEKVEVVETQATAKTAPARKPAARKPAAKKASTTKASAAKTAKSSAAKTSTAKPAPAQAEKAS
jgi:septal ring-binding cell division protein DamX